MKNLKHLTEKEPMNLLISTRCIHHFKLAICLSIIPFCMVKSPNFATTESIEELDKRLSIYPPTPDDNLPLIEVIENQLDAIRQNSIERAYFFYASKGFKEKTSLQNFKLFVKAN